VAKDETRGKATLVALLGVDGAKARLAALVHDAEAALASFDRPADTLIEAVRFAVNRKR
jgi:farnesyl diphosphate synthase